MIGKARHSELIAMGMTRILRLARLGYIVMEERYAQFAALFSIRRDHQDGGPIMKRLGMLGIMGGAAILTAVPLSLQWSQKNVALSLDSAEAQERPLTATSVAGVSRRVHRRAYRRAYRSAAYASAAGLYSGYGCPAYSNYWVPYGTSSAAPYGIYASSYAIACERLKSGYAAPY